jgi:hypothetical protein
MVENRRVDVHAMNEPADISAYFCILHDAQGNKPVAIRRAAQFKAVLKARLVQFFDDSLRAVGDHVFRLDSEFDVVIVDGTVLINGATSFELLADIEEGSIANFEDLSLVR